MKVSGTGEFFQQSASSSQEISFHQVYKIIEKSHVLVFSLNKDYPEMCNEDATHVVSRMEYGQSGYLSFKCQYSSEDDVTQLQGELTATVNSQPLKLMGKCP